MQPGPWKIRDTMVAPSPAPFEPSRRETDLDRRIAAMRAMLALARPGSDAEALRVLRDAFPETTLAERVAVLSAGAERQG